MSHQNSNSRCQRVNHEVSDLSLSTKLVESRVLDGKEREIFRQILPDICTCLWCLPFSRHSVINVRLHFSTDEFSTKCLN